MLTQRDLVETMLSSAEVEAQQAITVLDRPVFERYGDTVVFSHLSQSRPFKRAPLEPLINELLTAYAPYYALALVTDSRGRIIAASRMEGRGQPATAREVIGESVKDEPWLQQTLVGHEPVQVEDYHDDSLVNRTSQNPSPVMSFSALIRDRNGNPLGVWSTRMALTPLREALIGSQVPAATYEAPSLMLKSLSGNPILALGPAISGAPAATAQSSGFSRWPGLGWRVEVYPPKPETGQWLRVWTLRGLTGLLMLRGIAALGLVIQRRLLAPVSHLIAHAQAVTRTIAVQTTGSDSLDEAAPWSNRLVRLNLSEWTICRLERGRVRRINPARKDHSYPLDTRRFTDEVIHAGLDAYASILKLDARGHGDNGQMARVLNPEGRTGRLPLANSSCRFKAVHFRHEAIHQDCRIGNARQRFEGFQAVGDKIRAIAQLF